MKKKNASLVALVLLSVFVVLSFLPIVFTQQHWKADTYWNYRYKEDMIGGYTESYQLTNSLFSAGYGWLAVVIVLFAAVGIAALAFQLADNPKSLWRRLSFAPVGAMAFFALEVILVSLKVEDYGLSGKDTYYPAWGFYIMAALLLASVVLSVLVATGKLKNASPQHASQKIGQQSAGAAPAPNTAKSSAEALAQFKQLLDAGAITPQEYEAKKQQLLNL